MASLVASLQEDNGHRFGNFPNYYSFHSVNERLDLLTPELVSSWKSEAKKVFTICDIGCNDGTLTRALHDKISSALNVSAETDGGWSVRTLGLELDPNLVERAKASEVSSPLGSSLTFQVADVTESTKVDCIFNTFFGGGGGKESETARFDLITCFSTTMWIHVTVGDASFADFLRHLAYSANHLVIEPQPWRCYRQAATRLRRQRRPGLACFEEVANGSSDKLIEELIFRTITTGCTQRLEKPGKVSEASDNNITTRECDGKNVNFVSEPYKHATGQMSKKADQFEYLEISSAAGSWKRKVLLFSRVL